MGSMGVDCADYDHDGRLDFFQTSYQGEPPVLFRNLGNGTFEDVSRMTGASAGGLTTSSGAAVSATSTTTAIRTSST